MLFGSSPFFIYIPTTSDSYSYIIQGGNDCDNDFRILFTQRSSESGIVSVKSSFEKLLKFARVMIANENRWPYSRIMLLWLDFDIDPKTSCLESSQCVDFAGSMFGHFFFRISIRYSLRLY